jgi:hypothetical protein
MRFPPAAAVLVASLACVTAPARAPYALHQAPGMVLSNSPMLDPHSRPVRRGANLEVPYAFLVFNGGPAPLTLRPRDVSAQLETVLAEARCRGSGVGEGTRELPVEIGAGMEARIDCTVRLPEAAVALVASGDRTLQLAVSVPGLDGEQLHFQYFLRVEDAR